MCHGVGQDSYMTNVTKVSDVPCDLLVLHGGCLCVCVWGGAGPIAMRQQGTPSQMARCISPNPNPTIVSP